MLQVHHAGHYGLCAVNNDTILQVVKIVAQWIQQHICIEHTFGGADSLSAFRIVECKVERILKRVVVKLNSFYAPHGDMLRDPIIAGKADLVAEQLCGF